MMGRNVILLPLLALGFAAASNQAADASCTASVIAKVQALEDEQATLSPGEEWGPPTQLIFETESHTSYVCAEGSYCYESRGIRLKSCIIEAMPPDEGDDGSEIFFSIRN